MARVEWTPEAVTDVARLYQFIAQESPEAAGRIAGLLQYHTDLLTQSPGLGRLVDAGSGRRELYVPFGVSRYIVSYERNREGHSVILRVWHSREARNPV